MIRTLFPALLLALFANSQALSATFTVTSTADTAGSTCGASCTLRQAISAANASAGVDTIAFSIPGAGPHRITPSTALPALANASIDGYTQSDALANTHPHASNAVLKIILDGRSLTQTLLPTSNTSVRGLAVIGPANVVAISVSGGGTIAGNWFGVEPDGLTTVQHGVSVELNSATAHLVGGATAADRNVFAAAVIGVRVQTGGVSAANVVENNLFGLLPNGTSPAGLQTAISSIGSSSAQALRNNTISCAVITASFGAIVESNRFGTSSDGFGNPGCATGRLFTLSDQAIVGNTFGHFTVTPVVLASSVSGVRLRGNRIVGGTAVPFDLNNNGFSFNDLGDADVGANGLQNYPVFAESLRLSANTVRLSGSLNSLANTRFSLEFFASPELTRAVSSAFALANAERIGTTTVEVTTDNNGNATFGPIDMLFDGDGDLGAVSGIATRLDAGGLAIESSELGEARAIYAAASGDFIVTNSNPSGAGSLFRALLEAEARPDGSTRDRVVFNIPGVGPHVLTAGILNTLSLRGKLEIDGYTQSGSAPNTAERGSNAQLKIVLSAIKLGMLHDDSLLRGVVMQGPSALLGLAGGTVEGNFIGTSVDGSSISSTAGNTAQVVCDGPCRIGGMGLSQRNVIACPQQFSVSCIAVRNLGSAGSASIEGNLIGVSASGLSRLVIPQDQGAFQTSLGIEVTRQFTTIRGNVIGGLVTGIYAIGVGNVTIVDNRIGIGVDNTTPLGNARHGVHVEAANVQMTQNVLAHNGRDGIMIGAGSTLSTLIDNTLHSNSELGVDLNISNAGIFGDGVSPNDVGDVDTNANGGQNFPVLSNARRSAAGIVADVRLNSLPSTQYRLRYCYLTTQDPSGHGECDQPIVGISQTITTDANGDFSGTTPTLPFASVARLTASAARIQGAFEATSEFALNAPVNDVSETAIVSVTPNTSSFGQAISVTVSVTGPGATPTGTVQISASGGSCNATLSAGSASCSLIPGSVGALTLSANYLGAGIVLPSTASTSHTVSRANTSVEILSDTPDPSTFGDAITVSLRVTSLVTPTGSVTVSDGVGGACLASLLNGLASCVLTPGAGGALSLTASYQGTVNFNPSSDTEPHQVNAVASQLALQSNTPNPSVFGQLVTVAAQLSSGVGTPAGPIRISDGLGASCQIVGNTGQCGLLPNGVGNITLRADFTGTGTHLASTASAAQQVNPAATALSASTPTDTFGNTPRQFALMRFSVSVDAIAPGAGAPSGSITITGTAGVEVCVIVLPASGCDLIVQTPGLRIFQAAYSGEARFLPSGSELSVDVLADALFRSGFEEE